MERRSYFEMLGLEFDPPEKNERKVQQAIKAWKERVSDLLANETDDGRRSALSAELGLYDDMVETLKNSKLKNAEANRLKAQRISQLEKLLDIILVGQPGAPEVTNAQIRNIHLKLKLSPKTIEETYVKKGFTVYKREKAADLNEAFLSPVILKDIRSRIEQLRMLANPQYPWMSQVFDLFDLAYYFSREEKSDAASFRHKRTAELYSIMESGAVHFANDARRQGDLFGKLFTAGTTQVFN